MFGFGFGFRRFYKRLKAVVAPVDPNPVPANALTTENGEPILTESGDFIVME